MSTGIKTTAELTNKRYPDLDGKGTCERAKVDNQVNHPEHYNQGDIECIDAIKACMSEEAFKGFLKGSNIKYMWRYENKGKPAQDLDKAKWYLERLKEMM